MRYTQFYLGGLETLFMAIEQLCPCGSGKQHLECCGPFITGYTLPATPEQLMRSRYTAYTEANIPYIEATQRGTAAKNFNSQSAERWANNARWQKLEVIMVSPVKDETGFVEFKAYYYQDEKLQLIHEISKFKFIKGKWYYISGHSYKIS